MLRERNARDFGRMNAPVKPRRSPAAKNPPSRWNGDTKLGLLENLIGFHLRLAQDASFRAFASHSGETHLKPGRFAAMMVIQNNPGITQIALSRAIARDKSSITPLLQELHRRGLVSRRPSSTDRRSITLRLTKVGETMLQDLLTHAMDHDRQLDEIVGDRKAEFIAILKKIADTLA
jgi:DNA-binding MarR family transcriptional regulator